MSEPLNIVMNPAAGRFEVTINGVTAFTEYSLRAGEVMVLPHTLVPDPLRRHGVGAALAEAALGYARAHGLKVVPKCPFIQVYLKQHPEHLDLVEARQRAKLGL